MSTTDRHSILKEGSLLWKFARMNGFSVVERFWSVCNNYDTFDDTFRIAFSSSTRSVATLFACEDEVRPLSTRIDVTFKVDMDDDINDLSNDEIFNLIADIVEKKNLNIYVGKYMLWRKNISREEMLVKMDLWEVSMGDENGH